LLIPEAVPLASFGAASSTVVVSGATAIVIPTLITSSPGRMPSQ
jgi:hypothetical protein